MSDIVFNADSKFDIQLSAALVHERALARLLADAELKIEVKTETWQWRRTGNICIEYRNRGKLSGISTTEATHWVHELCDDQGKVRFRILFEVDELKRLCREAHRLGRYKLGVGDDGQSDVILLRLKDIQTWAS